MADDTDTVDTFIDNVYRTQSKAWFLTIDTPNPGLELAKHPGEKYAVWRLEEGGIRATMVFKNVVFFNKIKRLYPGLRKANIRKVINLQSAIKYCLKEKGKIDGPWERGEAPKSKRARTDIDVLVDTPIAQNNGTRRMENKISAPDSNDSRSYTTSYF